MGKKLLLNFLFLVYVLILFENNIYSKNFNFTQVVKFIEDHESRIHLETQFIDGEETLAWKWIVPTNSNLVNNFKFPTSSIKNDGIGLANSTMITPDMAAQSQTTTASSQLMTQDSSSVASIYPNLQSTLKAAGINTNANDANAQNVNGWQGDAFNRSDKLSHSPTSCLKIRNMFDLALINSDSQVEAKIHNDILEKCSPSNTKYFNTLSTCSILHISCDRKSKEGCVYVKCSSNEAAGRVYQNLNGTWYNGKLLNVKFLRGDRYLERFPESSHFTTPLQPILI